MTPTTFKQRLIAWDMYYLRRPPVLVKLRERYRTWRSVGANRRCAVRHVLFPPLAFKHPAAGIFMCANARMLSVALARGIVS